MANIVDGVRNVIYCNKCSTKLDDGSLFCNKCGHKVNYESESTLQVASTLLVSDTEKNSQKGKTKKKSVAVIIIVVAILLVGTGGGYWYYIDQQKKEAIKQEALIEEYKSNLASAVLRMMAFSLISENVCNLYSTVWKLSIESRSSITVNGKRAYDFNEAILYQREELQDKNILSAIKENTDEVDTLMRKLNNPPIEYQKSYDYLVELYGLYTQYAEQANAPTGSLLEFNKKTNELSSQISKLYKQFKILLPSLDETKMNDYTDSIKI